MADNSNISYIAEVRMEGSERFTYANRRFATPEDAHRYAKMTYSDMPRVAEYRVVSIDERPNYAFTDDYRSIRMIHSS